MNNLVSVYAYTRGFTSLVMFLVSPATEMREKEH